MNAAPRLASGDDLLAIYDEARPGYHAVSRTVLDRMLDAGS